jgi:hypothetical protein
LDNTAIRLHQLIGAPLVATLQVDAQAAGVNAAFIERIALERQTARSTRADVDRLQMVEFDSPLQDASGRIATKRQRLPALSLLPIPLMQVERAQFEFAFRVRSHTRRAPHLAASALENLGVAHRDFLTSRPIELKGTIGTGTTAPGAPVADIRITLTVRVKHVDNPASPGEG